MATQKVITGWTHAWRLHTVKLGAALMVIPQALIQITEALGAVLPALPQEIKEYLPENVRAALAIAGAAVVVLRLWRQGNVDQYFEKDR